MKLIANEPFSWAHRGCEIEHFAKDQVIETEDEDMIRVATAEGWARLDGEKAEKPAATKPSKAPEDKAKKSAPENK